MSQSGNEHLAGKVLDAWRVEGRNPQWHRLQKRKLQQEWPMLYKALQRLDDGWRDAPGD